MLLIHFFLNTSTISKSDIKKMRNTKKSLIIFLILLFSVLISINGQASYFVPAEITIKTDGSLQSSKEISVYNNDNKALNVSWYLEKTPQSYLKKNKSNLPDHTWINITPKFQKIQPKETAIFKIKISIPNEISNYNKKWMVWLTFKTDSTTNEQVTTLLINTPDYTPSMSNKTEYIEIKMTKNFFHGNTTKKIGITNSFEKEINVESKIEHPEVFSKKNYTKIPNLSWINTHPVNTTIKPGETKKFYIYVDPEEKQEYTNQLWETSIVFKACFTDDSNNCTDLGTEARVFLITPEEVNSPLNNDEKIKGVSMDKQDSIPFSPILIYLVILFFVLIVFFVYRKKDKK